MSPKSRGRQRKPARGRPRPQRAAVQDDPFGDALVSKMVRDVGRELEEIHDALQAELCVSALLGTWWRLFLVDADPEVLLGERLVATAGRRRSTAALALLRAVAVLGTPDQRTAAADAADALAAKGVAEPAWAADLAGGRVRSAWGYGDVFGDQTSVLLTIDRGGDSHGVVVLIDHTLGGIAKDAFVTDDPAGTLADLRAMAEPAVWTRELTLDEAARLLRPAFATTDEVADPPVGEDFREYRALALARLRLLPEVEPTPTPVVDGARREAVVAEFLDSLPGRALGRRGVDVAGCARLIVEHGCATDGQPLRVGPAKIEQLLLAWLPDHDVDEDRWEALPAVLRAWVRWAGERAGLPAPAVRALEETVDEIAAERDDPQPPGLDDAVLDGLLGGDVTPEQVQEAVARRVFATPHTTAVLDGERMQLDPSDPDERGLLIRAEHPEYADALDDPYADFADAEVNPRLHVAMHEMVATQLWDGDPAEVWPAAQRLLATGMDRHDVLHALAEVAIHHVHAALVRQQPYDAAAYAADLAALGAPSPPARRRRPPRTDQPGLFAEPAPATVTPLRPRSTAAPAYRVKVTLRGVRPPVWRRLLLPPDTTLAGLHAILQVAMGWRGGHLHQFVAGNRLYGPPDLDAGPGQRDEATVRLDAVLRRAGDRLRYEYDFGDGWEHDVVLESVEADPVPGAQCTAGRRACPPEDCGGPWGYGELLAAVADPHHPEHAERVEWAGPYFDPVTFDRQAVNDQLAALGTAR